MYRSIKHIYLGLILLVGLLAACHKEEEPDIPQVDIYRPYINQLFRVGDTINITAEIRSISPIQNIIVGIVDSKLVPLVKNRSYTGFNGKNGGTLQYGIILDDAFMDAGNYNVCVIVNNEKERKYKYRKIRILTENKKLLGAVVVTKTANHVQLWKYYADLSHKTLVKSMQADYGGSVYLPFHNRMVLSGRIQGECTMWDFISGDTVYQAQAQANPPFPYFTSIGLVNRYPVVAYYSGDFDLLNYSGSKYMKGDALQDYYVQKVFDVGDNFVTVEKHKYSTKSRLVCRLKSTAASYSFINLNDDEVVAALPFDGKDFMLFRNRNGSGRIDKFVWNQNGTTQVFPYNGDRIMDALWIGGDQYYLLTENAVLWYRYGVSSVTKLFDIKKSLQPLSLRYDPLSGRIWILYKNYLAFYDKNGTEILSRYLTEDCLDLHLIYNR